MKRISFQTLLDLGASPNYRDTRGLTPLYHCVLNDTTALCTEILLHDHSVVGVSDERGWQEIHQSDMMAVCDPSTAVIDPFFTKPTVSVIADIVDPETRFFWN